MTRPTVALACAVLVAGITTSTAPSAEARADTCQGQAATVVGPTSGQDTTGTEGDDVIVAPLNSNSTVQGLGGNDTICLVDGPMSPSRDPFVTVLAGAGNDSVTNESTRVVRVDLGTGADSFVGNDLSETVAAADQLGLGTTNDSEVDVIDTRGGNDSIASGSAGFANHDVLNTGPGDDTIRYGEPAGGAIDNGTDTDLLILTTQWTGELTIDNVTRTAAIDSTPVLTWTAIRGFGVRVAPGSGVSFAGSDADEGLSVSGTVLDLVGHTTITTGGGNDNVTLENYLPDSVDLGAGFDTLGYLQCDRADVRLNVAASCTSGAAPATNTALAGIESLLGRSRDVMNVRGTTAVDWLSLHAKLVLVEALAGRDRVRASGREVVVRGGAGADRLRVSGLDMSIARGGRGPDLLRGHDGPDRLYGAAGRDRAVGKAGKDLCRAEVKQGCEV